MLQYSTANTKFSSEELLVKKDRAIVGLVLVTAVFFFMLFVFAFLTVKGMRDAGEVTTSGLSSGAKIAVIEVKGTIMESKKIIEMLQKASENKSLKAIIVRIDSPGGAVGPTQEIFDEIMELDKKIPVYASFGSVAASGGYYIGAAARKIFCNRGTITGSIGVIMQFMDLSKLFEFAKLSPEIVKAGKYKDMGQPSRALTEEEKKLLKNTIDSVHKQFVVDIEKRRKEVIKGDIWEMAQGQIFSGEEAHKLGLIDELGGLWEAGRKIHEELKLKGEFKGFKFIKEKKQLGLLEILEDMEGVSDKFSSILGSIESPIPMAKYILTSVEK